MEYRWFHLPGAHNLPAALLDAGNMPPGSSGQEVVVICMTGHRSPVAAFRVKRRGYSRVSHLTGGMLGWQAYAWISRFRGG
jgi:rhodanese-related sulfurtransferase